MLRKRKNILIYWVLVFSLIFPLSSAYSYYNVLAEADFLYRGQKFEAADLEDLFAEKQTIWEFEPNAFSVICPLEALFQQATGFFAPILSLNPLSSVLRC